MNKDKNRKSYNCYESDLKIRVMKFKNMAESERIFECENCNLSFTTKQGFLNHMDTDKMTNEKIDLKKEINELPNMEDHSLDYFLRMLATVAVSVGYDKGHPENEEISKWQDRVKKKVEQLLKQREDLFEGNLRFKLKQLIWDDEDIERLINSRRKN